jgi:ribosome-associated toxin RatA of RatAB toxin-antitoxin module
VPSYIARQCVTIAATPQQCFDALTDYASLPDWQGGLKSATVVESLPDGAVVDYELDAKVKTVRYRLRLTYDEPTRIDSAYLQGDFKRLDAGWTLTDDGNGGTEAELAIDLDPGRFVPGPIRSVVQNFVMSGALRDLKTRLEAPSA